MKQINTWAVFSLLVVLFCISGCSSFFGSLRKDLDDSPGYEEPTVGGLYPERGLLDGDSEEMDGRRGAVGHSERGPASYRGSSANSWISSSQSDAAKRDEVRGSLSYSNVENLDPPIKRIYRTGNRATKADFVDEAPNEASLWAPDGQTNYYFTKNRIRTLGDILTIKVEDQLLQDVGTEIKRTLTEDEMDAELLAAQDKARAQSASSKEKTPTSPASPAADPKKTESTRAPAGAEREVTPADVDVLPSLGMKAGDTLMAEIVERYPNGNYKLRATKRVNYKGSPRMLTLMGIARADDIEDQMELPSSKLYEYKVKAYH